LSLLPSFGTTHRFALLKVSGQTLQLRSDRLYRAVNASPRYGHASFIAEFGIASGPGVVLPGLNTAPAAYLLHCDGAPGVPGTVIMHILAHDVGSHEQLYLAIGKID
jgi:hypothetical protein